MSISDELMWRYYALLTDVGEDELSDLQARVARGDLHPRQAKVDLAVRIVSDFHSAGEANAAAAEFDRVHVQGALPADLKDVVVAFGGEPARALARVLVDAGLAASASDAGRRMQQGGVKLGGVKVTDPRARVDPSALPAVLQSGRHAVRLIAG
jgi:tyrosyl-tRNA synthetase